MDKVSPIDPSLTIELFEAIRDIIDLPEAVKSLDLHLSTDSMVTYEIVGTAMRKQNKVIGDA